MTEENVLGMIKCLEVREQEDGSALLVFDVDEEFKTTYNKIFNLSEWSQEHFEATIAEAIEAKIREHKKEN